MEMMGCGLSCVSPSCSFPSVVSQIFYGWLLMVQLLLRAVLVFHVSRITVILMSLSSCVCKALERIGILAVLRNHWLDMDLQFIAYCHRR